VATLPAQLAPYSAAVPYDVQPLAAEEVLQNDGVSPSSVQNVPSGTFFCQNYLQWEFSQDYYPYSPCLAQVAYSMLPSTPFNETHMNNHGYNSLYQQANAAASPALRKEILHEMQEFDFTQGGYIIPTGRCRPCTAAHGHVAGSEPNPTQVQPPPPFRLKRLAAKRPAVSFLPILPGLQRLRYGKNGYSCHARDRAVHHAHDARGHGRGS
jgi:hypothetical protein